MSNIKQIKQVSIKDNKLKATIEVYNERTADSYQTSYQNECPIHAFVCSASSTAFL